MPGQTVINPDGQPVGFAGLVSDNYASPDFISAFSEEASASIPFGVAVKQGTARQGALNMSSSGDDIKGINAFDFEHAPGSFGDIDASSVGIVPKGRLKILRKGRIFVVIDQSISSITPFHDRAFIRYSANGDNTVVGAFTYTNDSGHTTDATRIGVFTSGVLTAADGTKIAEIEVDFTNRNS